MPLDVNVVGDGATRTAFGYILCTWLQHVCTVLISDVYLSPMLRQVYTKVDPKFLSLPPLPFENFICD